MIVVVETVTIETIVTLGMTMPLYAPSLVDTHLGP